MPQAGCRTVAYHCNETQNRLSSVPPYSTTEQRKGWSLMIFFARATRGRRRDGEGAARCPPCSQNAHGETVLVRCAQWKINQPPSLKGSHASPEGSFRGFFTSATSLNSSNDSILKLSFYRRRDSPTPDRHRENIPNPFYFASAAMPLNRCPLELELELGVAKCAPLYTRINLVTSGN